MSDLDGLADREERLCEALAAYFEAAQAGQVPDRDAWLARYPDLAHQLAGFLADEDRLLRATAPLRSILPAGDPAREGNGSDQGSEEAAPRTVGDYELLEEIARGGMGVVYKARQRGLGRRVALKLVLAGRFAAPDEVRRFRVEAEAAAQLDHPNIVPIFEVGEHAGLPFFSMKLLDDGSLADQLDRFRDDPRAVARLVATIARAVQHAHERGILHRDLKPSNILLDAAGRPYVTDFGLAKRLDSGEEATRTGAVLGSPPYMAPEQVAGDKRAVTTVADVYGLGAILYALLTGRPPFRGDSVVETIERVKAGHPDPPSGINRAIAPDLEAICLKCLEKDPHRRYRSAEDLAEDLDRWLSGLPTRARPRSPVSRLGLWAWRRRRRLIAACAAAVIVGLIGFEAWQARQLRMARQVAQQHDEMIRRGDRAIRQVQYSSDIRRASVLVTLGNARMARDILDRHRPASGEEDLRGFERSYLRNTMADPRRSWVGHDGREVYHVEYAPDGRTFATAGADRTARVWDAETGRPVHVLRGHKDEVNFVSFSPDGSRLVTAGDDATVRVWDASDGRELRVLDGRSSPAVAALYTPDGRDIIGATRDCSLVRWDAATGQRRAGVRSFPDRWTAESLAISPQGTTLVLGARPPAGEPLLGNFAIHDLSADGLAMTRKFQPGGFANCAAFSRDGRTLAVTGSGRNHAVLYDLAGERPETILGGANGTTYTLAFAPDGRTIAVGDVDRALQLWDLETQTVRTSLLGHTERIWSVAYAPDGRTLTTTSRDGTIRTWEAAGHSDRAEFRGLRRDPTWNEAASVAFSEGGSRLLAANRAGDVLACDLATGRSQVLRTAETLTPGGFVSLAPDGTTLAVSSRQGDTDTVTLHDLVGGREPVVLASSAGWAVNGAAWSPDGKRIALSDSQDHLTLWDTAGRPLGQVVAASGSWSSAPVFLPAGDALVMVSGAGAPRQVPFDYLVWEPARSRVERHLVPANLHPAGKVVVSPDGRTLWSDWGLWDLSPLPRHRLNLIGHSDGETDAVFSPDGRTLATASLDRTVRLWNVASGQELLTLEGHTGPIRILAFSRDGSALASCGDGPDGSIEVIVWRAGSHAHGDPAEASPSSP
jgi:WD40 repeat protein